MTGKLKAGWVWAVGQSIQFINHLVNLFFVFADFGTTESVTLFLLTKSHSAGTTETPPPLQTAFHDLCSLNLPPTIRLLNGIWRNFSTVRRSSLTPYCGLKPFRTRYSLASSATN